MTNKKARKIVIDLKDWEPGQSFHIPELENLPLSEEGQKELREQAKRESWDLLHELMLYNYVVRYNGSLLKTDDDGHIHIVNKPKLNKAIIEKMKKEIEELSPSTRYEVMVKLSTKFPEIAEKLNDLYVKYMRMRS